MKKLISILLVVVMLVAMVPAMAFTTSAAMSGTWADAGNYDISWCTTLEASSGETITIDGKYYHVKGNWTRREYTIDTPAKLAGLAYLVNNAGGDCFKGEQFFITADLDLGAHRWISIGEKYKFRGSLIGKKNGEEGASVTISNMYVDNTSKNGISSGLIGVFGGDWIKNIDLKDATIIAKDFTVGSFVGWQNGNIGSGSGGQGGYQNLSSDAEIILTSQRTGDQYDDVGGIVGVSNSCNASNKSAIIDNCVFTGTISAPYADNVGGIFGLWQNTGIGVSISNCVVISDKIEWGKDNTYLSNSKGHNVGCGGIAGNLYSNNTSDPVSLTNCYVAANIITLAATNTERYSETINVGGIVGASCSQTKTFTNCQFDGTITGKSGSIGAILGRVASNNDINKINNSVVSGVAMRSSGDISTYVGGAVDGLTVSKVYNSIEMTTGNSGDIIAPITEETDFAGLDFDAVWTKGENDLYPILSIAVPYLNADTDGTPSVAKSGMDFSWVTFDDGMKIANDSQLNGLEKINKVHSTAGANLMSKATVNPVYATKDISGYSVDVQNFIKSALSVAEKVDDGTIFDVVNENAEADEVFAQVSLEKNANDLYDIRFVITVNDISACDGVMFDVAASRGDKFGEFLESDVVVTKCYKTVVEITADGEVEHTAEGDAYYVICVVNNVDLSADTTFTVRANAVTVEGKTTTLIAQSAAVNFVVPAAN